LRKDSDESGLKSTRNKKLTLYQHFVIDLLSERRSELLTLQESCYRIDTR
jgi:hypothetical protein